MPPKHICTLQRQDLILLTFIGLVTSFTVVASIAVLLRAWQPPADDDCSHRLYDLSATLEYVR